MKMKMKVNCSEYQMIPNATLISMMGVKRWKVIEDAVFKKFKTKKIVVEFRRPPVLRAEGIDGTYLGTVAEVERWAKGKGKLGTDSNTKELIKRHKPRKEEPCQSARHQSQSTQSNYESTQKSKSHEKRQKLRTFL